LHIFSPANFCIILPIKANHEKVIIALLTANTVREAAVQCGISEGHIHRLRRDENFRKILKERREELFSFTNNRAIAYREKAFSILCEIAENEGEPSCNRISAVKQILFMGDSVREEEFEERLQKLEELYSTNERPRWPGNV
jgi:hypothetical protein